MAPSFPQWTDDKNYITRKSQQTEFRWNLGVSIVRFQISNADNRKIAQTDAPRISQSYDYVKL